MWHMWQGGYGMGGIWMLIFWVFIIIIGIVVVYWLINSQSKNKSRSMDDNLPANSAVEILKARYARGEITGKEYKKMMEDLKK